MNFFFLGRTLAFKSLDAMTLRCASSRWSSGFNFGANAAALDDVEMTPAAYAQEKGHALLMTLLKKWEQEPGAAQSAGPSLSQTYP